MLVEAFRKIEMVRNKIALTFFEFTTLAALIIFQQSDLELLVLEIGLGGRLDAVNMVEPSVSILTCIDFDHQSWLGHEITQIAYEKAGIYRKNGINLIGDSVSLGYLQDVEEGLSILPELVTPQTLQKGQKELQQAVASRKTNPYQLLFQNVNLACVAFSRLFRDKFEQVDLTGAISNIELNGRFQRLKMQPSVILDVGHNVQAARNLVKQVATIQQKGRLIVICGMMADKSISDVIDVMDPIVDQWYFVDLPIDRAATAEKLYDTYLSGSISVATRQQKCHQFESVSQAYDKIKLNSNERDVILVFGSFVTVAQMMDYVKQSILD
jgi:dihydrofolate synthase/folylpolyglutamate synthase